MLIHRPRSGWTQGIAHDDYPLRRNVLIVGGGLSGLYLAWQCQRQNIDFELVEARGRFGGRVLNLAVTQGGQTGQFDLGPAWYWPGQPRIAELCEQLNLSSFQQYSTGAVLYEDEKGEVFRGGGNASMQGAFRMVGGIGSLINALTEKIEVNRIRTASRVTGIRQIGQTLETLIERDHQASETVISDQVVLALPPRVIAETINLQTLLGEVELQAMRAIPTWMAGNAKIIAVYEQSFWRSAGLSGDATSRRGPMVEIHDASPTAGGPFALFGFVGVPAAVRARQNDELMHQARLQLSRLFGKAALEPFNMTLQDWATEIETATSLDASPPSHHPEYGLPTELARLGDGRLILASTETASTFGGYLEGSLAAAQRALSQIQVIH